MGARSSQSRGPGVNETDGHLLEYFRNTFGGGGGAAAPIDPQSISATGGTVQEYTSGSDNFTIRYAARGLASAAMYPLS